WQRLVISGEFDMPEPERVLREVTEIGLAGTVIREQRGAVVYDTLADERWYMRDQGENTARSALCLPIVQDGEVLAIMTLVHTEPNHFNEHQLRLLGIVTNQASVAIRNAQLFSHVQAQQL